MLWSCRRKARTLAVAREDGVVAAEFVLLFPLLLLIVVGMVELGHLWYVRHAITNASREGARSAVVYRVDPGDPSLRLPGAAVQAQAETVANSYLQTFLPAGTWQSQATLTPLAGYQQGAPLTVRVTASHYLLLLDKLIPAFGTITVQAETTMRME